MFFRISGEHPDRVCLRTPNVSLTYRQLRSAIASYALHMRELGIGPTSIVALDTAFHHVGVSAYLAVAVIGCRWVQATRSALRTPRVGVTHILHDDTRTYPKEKGFHVIGRDWTSPPRGEVPDTAVFDETNTHRAPWCYAQSSGTTGRPKVMQLTHDQIALRLDDIHLAPAPTQNVIAHSFHPLGAPSILFSLKGLLAPAKVVIGDDYDFLVTEGVNHVYGTPKQLALMCKRPPPKGAKIASAEVVGAKASPRLLEHLFDYFNHLHLTYTSTECGRISTRRLGPDDRDTESFPPPVHPKHLEIVDDRDEPVLPGTEGRVRVRSATMVSSYLGDDHDNQSAFRDGWFYPGDLGCVRDDGMYVITGRVDDLLTIGGVKINAALIDNVLHAHSDIADGICFEYPGPLGVPEVAVLISLENNASPEEIAVFVRQQCAKTVGKPAVPEHIFVGETVPRNQSGKPMRHAVPDLIRDLRSY